MSVRFLARDLLGGYPLEKIAGFAMEEPVTGSVAKPLEHDKKACGLPATLTVRRSGVVGSKHGAEGREAHGPWRCLGRSRRACMPMEVASICRSPRRGPSPGFTASCSTAGLAR